MKIRRNITELQQEYESGNKVPLETLMRAWKGMKARPPGDPQSFFALGGLHGEPFRGAGWGNGTYWGGYCNHGNVLFPTWHRVYLYKLEQALQSVPGCAEVMLPFWDESSADSRAHGIPWALTVEKFLLDGVQIDNPLRSFVLPEPIHDNINGDDPNYSKLLPNGVPYETVRYPLSGLVGSKNDLAATIQHNSHYPNYDQNVVLLNRNVANWINLPMIINGQQITEIGIARQFEECLKAPNYTVFSNTTSAQEYNNHLPPRATPIVPLESPHNFIHLSVGGYDVSTGPNAGDFSPLQGANGDMGENDTAGLDPIFYFHHCNVDRMFWVWQKRHDRLQHTRTTLEIIDGYPGTNSVDNQGPTPGVVPNSWLTMDSPLAPFKNEQTGRTYTSRDCIDIERQLGLTYGPGSLDGPVQEELLAAEPPVKTLKVSGVNRAPIRGSFLISAYAHIDGVKHLVGVEAVLSRWNVSGCANCQTHLETKAFFPIRGLPEKAAAEIRYEVVVRGRDGVVSSPGGDRRGQKVAHRIEVI